MLCQVKCGAERSGCDLMSHRPICSRFEANLHGQDTRYSMLQKYNGQRNKKLVNKFQLSVEKVNLAAASPPFSKSSRPLSPSYSSMTLRLGSLTK